MGNEIHTVGKQSIQWDPPKKKVVIFDNPDSKQDIDGDGIGDVSHTEIAKQLYLMNCKNPTDVQFDVRPVRSYNELVQSLNNLQQEVAKNKEAFKQVILVSGGTLDFSKYGGKDGAYASAQIPQAKQSYQSLEAISKVLPTYVANENNNTQLLNCLTLANGPIKVSTQELSVDNYDSSEKSAKGGFSYKVENGKLTFFDAYDHQRQTDILASTLSAKQKPVYQQFLQNKPATEADYKKIAAIQQNLKSNKISIVQANQQMNAAFKGKLIDTQKLNLFGFRDQYVARIKDLGPYAVLKGDLFFAGPGGKGLFVEEDAFFPGFRYSNNAAQYQPGGFQAKPGTVPVQPFTSWATPIRAGLDSAAEK